MISLASLVKMRPLAAAVVSLDLGFPLCAHTYVLFCLFREKRYRRLSRYFTDIELHDAVLIFLIDGRGVVGTTATGDYS